MTRIWAPMIIGGGGGAAFTGDFATVRASSLLTPLPFSSLSPPDIPLISSVFFLSNSKSFFCSSDPGVKNVYLVPPVKSKVKVDFFFGADEEEDEDGSSSTWSSSSSSSS